MTNNIKKQKERFEKLKIQIKSDPYLNKLFEKKNFYYDFDDVKWFLKYAEIFNRYFESQNKLCKFNFDKEKCRQLNKGFQETIIIKNNSLILISKECNCNLINKIKKYFLFFNFKTNFFNFTFRNNCYLTNSRQRIIIFFSKWLKEEINNSYGTYIFGKPNIGKTFLSILFANNIARKQEKNICFITNVELINIVRTKIIQKKISALKALNFFMNIDVLFLDDFGGEKVTTWSRDEVLFSLLNFRMNNNKSTFFTSNFSIKQLIFIYKNIKSNSSTNFNKKIFEIETIKSLRLIRRIKSLCYKNLSFNLDQGYFEKN